MSTSNPRNVVVRSQSQATRYQSNQPIPRRGLMLSTNLHAGFKALQANSTRTFLTMLGIIIGVAAVITSVTLTQGVSAGILQRNASLGTNVLTITPVQTSTVGVIIGGPSSSLTLADVSALTAIAHVTAITPVLSAHQQVIYSNQNWNPHVLGVYPSFQSIQNWQIDEGTWFSQSDELGARPKVVMGPTTVQSLFGPTGEDPIGKTIHINGQLFQIVGTTQSQGTQLDDAIFMPFSTYEQRVANVTNIAQILVQADDVNNVAQIQQAITTLLENRHHIRQGLPDNFRVTSVIQLIQQTQTEATAFTFLFGGIAAISLIVGGIGIMNIMLVSVTERIREIGIRMAIGARRSDIHNQFLIESATLSVLGGLIGILLGLFVGYAIVSDLGVSFVFNLAVILLAVGVAAAVGIIFGLYPAIRASRLDPIIALRQE
ncbi:MAG TPA: ABC transporter permease [Ktedonobacteraceae bacterium]|nr:ABC transporter permease [Ktedonobacteraceae bacterium]